MNDILSYLPNWFIDLYIVLFGLCVGSLLNVLILRGLSGEDIIFARSKCPKCANIIKWYMNIPVFSYIFLKGRCAYCKERISLQYPIIELLTALLFLYSYNKIGLNWLFIFSIIFISFSITMFVTDIKERVIISYHTYIIAIFGLLASIFGFTRITILGSVLGLILGFAFFEIISLISKKLFSMRAFGEGDTLIAMAYGTVIGFKNLLILIFLAILIQSLSSIPILLKNNIKDKKYKLAVSYMIIILSLILIIFNAIFETKYGANIYLAITFITISLLLWSLVNILKELNQKKKKFENLNIKDEDVYNNNNPFILLPFGPSLVIAFFICFFYSNELVQIIKNYLY